MKKLKHGPGLLHWQKLGEDNEETFVVLLIQNPVDALHCQVLQILLHALNPAL